MIPLLLITYKRHENILNIIRQAEERKIEVFIWNNKPLEGQENHEDFIKIKKILNEINYSKLHIRRPENHLSFNKSITSAIDWFYEINDIGLILEDDCIPANSFYDFINITKSVIMNDSNIKVATGSNLLSKKNIASEAIVTDMTHVWGWVTTASIWKKFRKEESKYELKISNIISKNFENKKDRIYWNTVITLNKYKHQNEISWDYKWLLFLWKNNYLTIIPKVNLIKNVGYDKYSTNKLINRSNLFNNKIGIYKTDNQNIIILKDYSYKKELMKKHYLSNWLLNILRYIRMQYYASYKKIF